MSEFRFLHASSIEGHASSIEGDGGRSGIKSLTILLSLLSLLILLNSVNVPIVSGATPLLPSTRLAHDQHAYVTDGDLAYVAVANHNYLAVVDPLAGVVTESIDLAPSGCAFPWRVAIPPDGHSVWVSCRGSGTVIVIDRSSHEILQAITAQETPADITFTHDSAYALIGSIYHSNVIVLDTATYAVETSIATDGNPINVVMHPYLPVAYAAHRLYEGLVSVIDTTSWTVVEQISVGTYPQHIAISRDGLQLYIAIKDPNSVAVIDTASLNLETEINLDTMPRDLAISPDGLTLYVTRSWGDEIALINTNSNTVQQTVELDPGDNFYRPWGTELNCDGTTLITTNSASAGEENKQVALTDTDTLTTELIPMPDLNSDEYPDSGARGLAVCPQYVPQDIFLTPASQTKQANRGGDAIYTVTLYNFSGAADSYTLALDTPDWTTDLSDESIGPLNSGESAVVTVTVTVPEDAEWYATDVVNLTATSVAAPETYEATAVLETEAFSPPAMTLSPSSLTSTQDAGEVVQKTLNIANGLGVDLEFELGTSFGPGTSFTAASTELYGYMVSGGFLRIIGLSDDTDVQLIDLADGSIIDQTKDLGRFKTWEAYHNNGTYFKLVADKPIVAVYSDGSYWGFTSFIPSIDTGPVGKDFIFYHNQGDSSLYIFAMDDADIDFRNENDVTLNSKSLKAGEYWNLNPNSGVYHVITSGRVALELVAENSYTTVPSTGGRPTGKQFYFATDGWGTGAVAAFAYEDADIELYDLNDDTLLHSTSILAGEYWWQVGLEDRQLRLESSGEVEVWAGNTEGSSNIEDLGDDISYAGGRLGREYFLHSLREGFVIFAPFDNTEINVDQKQYSLNKDEYLHFPECCGAHKIVANKAVLVQTLGRDGSWNDMGSYLGGVVAHSGEPVPWLVVDPGSGTAAPESTQTIDVTFDAGGLQPGTHAADLIVISNDPAQPFVEVPLTMLVEPTSNMGRVSGSISDAWTGEDLKASVTLEGVHTTLAAPAYEIWAAAASYKLTVNANGYVSREFTIDITSGSVTALDIALEPNLPRLELEPETLTMTAVEGATAATALTIRNTGPAPLPVSLHEMAALDMLSTNSIKNRKILFDRGHDGPTLHEVETLVNKLTAAGAVVDENFVYPIDATVLAGYDVLWVNAYGFTDWTFNELNVLKAWLDGGGAIFIHGENSPATNGAADIYGINYHDGCNHGTSMDIEDHKITIGVSRVFVDTCSYLTFGSGSIAAVKDTNGQPHVVVHEENGGKMAVVAGQTFNNWAITEEDNLLLANNIFAWLAEPGYEDIVWLHSDLSEIEIAGHASYEATIEADASELALGTYEAIVAIEHNDSNRVTPVKVPVTFIVQSSEPIVYRISLPVVLGVK